MQYRPFGRLGWQGSALGFGCMRLPTTGGRHRRLPGQRCPQRIPISDWMAYIHHVLGEGGPYSPAERPQQ